MFLSVANILRPHVPAVKRYLKLCAYASILGVPAWVGAALLSIRIRDGHEIARRAAYAWFFKATLPLIYLLTAVCGRAFMERRTVRYDYQRLRHDFCSVTAVAKKNSRPSHSHPIEAANRSAAILAMDQFCVENNMLPHFVRISTSLQMRNYRGERVLATSADFEVSPQMDAVLDNTCLIFVDSDYYVDVPYYSTHMKPMLFYTFDPIVPAAARKEYSFRVINGNRVHMSVAGGAEYRHQLNNFDGDAISFDYGWKRHIYKMERTRVFEDHSLVILVPSVSVPLPVAPVCHRVWEPRQLQIGGFASTCSKSPDGQLEVHLAYMGVPHSVSLPQSLYESIRTRQKYATKPMLYTVEANLKPVLGDSTASASPLIHSAILAGLSVPVGQVQYDRRGVEYSYRRSNIHMDMPIGRFRTAHPAMVDNGFVPALTVENDEECVSKRIVAVRNTVDFTLGRNASYIGEFVTLLGNDKLAPYSIDTVLEKQNRPAQRAAFARSSLAMLTDQFTVSSFQKAESYAGLKDPRNISTVPGYHRVGYARYTLPLSDYVKQAPWYAFGKTPLEISNAVHAVCSSSTHVIPTDFSRWDGRHSPGLVKFESAVIRHFFDKDDADNAINLQLRQYGSKGYTNFGVKYSVGSSRLSGSADTSLFNTLCNAFIAYVVLRRSDLTVEQAWQKLGLYGGDDGLTPDVDPSLYTSVCQELGLVLEAKQCYLGDSVTFLGRVYTNPWVHNLSFYDLNRFLSKAHIIVSPLVVPIEQALFRKAEGFKLNDCNTPIIGAWSRSILSSVSPSARYDIDADRERSYISKITDETNCYPQPHPDDSEMWCVAAATTGLPMQDLICLDQYWLTHGYTGPSMDVPTIIPRHVIVTGPVQIVDELFDTGDNTKTVDNVNSDTTTAVACADSDATAASPAKSAVSDPGPNARNHRRPSAKKRQRARAPIRPFPTSKSGFNGPTDA